MNAITYKEVFPLIKENKLWFGYGFNCSMIFKTKYKNTLEANRKYVISKGYDPDDNYIKTPAVCWWTNLETKKRNEFLDTGKKYYGYEEMYPKYDNYEAINVDNVKDIPIDYDGVMGVPITFLDKYNPEQFEIVGITKTWYGGASKIYSRQIQVDKNGKRKEVTKLNDGATLELLSDNVDNQTYYEVDGKKYIQLYARVLIKKKGV